MDSPAPTPYLDLQAVETWLGPRRVFEDLTLQLHRGEHTVILGPNGSGKSSLIKLLSRELYPVVKPGSHLRLFGSDCVNLWQLRARIGLVSADLQATHLSGGVGRTRASDVVLSGFFGSVGLGRSQQPSAAQHARVAELLEQLGLTDLAARPYAELSDGQRRRLLLARALVHDPEVLVLDEPTNGLDLKARHQLLDQLRRLARAGTTLLLVTHQIEAIVPEIERAVLLRQGRVVGDGPTADLLQEGVLSELFDTPLRVLTSNGYRQVLPAG
ncbi:ABC transporter ATP-binding protein [Vulcanococcus limneticus]|uniref:ABC transporter ATP-binding protein n=1 Tax=Vulcanococcus limneticus TaxID=2170428 RepID=UPI000B9857CC|nr:ATP-binding cassette domain-containing protein [Vulcanococcus limneticus]MCP9791578.1 ATP-binding cassette domain-containing protein [Vulcanococcus limneticus MW73D5]MCP9893434.1 ATP-binding cassette domain-containing protein [Vulcanococcus limneticus Candia 3F8]MCP9897008.1 ATP-binding cassette domain-containing protein [Vulcanococcus limneticus Candia 3B3]